MNILITGIAGFIGSHLAKHLLSQGHRIVGIDDFNDNLYESSIKYDRCKHLLGFTDSDLEEIRDHEKCCFASNARNSNNKNIEIYKCDISKQVVLLNDIFFLNKPFDVVINLAAYANPILSMSEPDLYMQTNVIGFYNILQLLNEYSPKAHFIYASTSSVYGNEKESPNTPSLLTDNTDHPVSLYAASKKCDELFAYAYSSLYGIKTTGLRFFTVYGPWGRPDMAMFKFTKAILKNKPIDVYNYGNNYRDFTYIDDLIHCISLLINKQPETNYSIYNIGSQHPIKLSDFISTLESNLDIVANKNMLPAQKGDTTYTYSDMTKFIEDYSYAPNTPFDVGVKNFVSWYRDYLL